MESKIRMLRFCCMTTYYYYIITTRCRCGPPSLPDNLHPKARCKIFLWNFCLKIINPWHLNLKWDNWKWKLHRFQPVFLRRTLPQEKNNRFIPHSIFPLAINEWTKSRYCSPPLLQTKQTPLHQPLANQQVSGTMLLSKMMLRWNLYEPDGGQSQNSQPW